MFLNIEIKHWAVKRVSQTRRYKITVKVVHVLVVIDSGCGRLDTL
jgi:hypothetical protein